MLLGNRSILEITWVPLNRYNQHMQKNDDNIPKSNNVFNFKKSRDAYTWRKRLLQLVSFLGVKNTECVKVLWASNLKLNNIPAPLDFDWTGILPSCSKKEILNLVDLFRLWIIKDKSELLKHSKPLYTDNSNKMSWNASQLKING